MKIVREILSILKLVCSMLAPILFISNVHIRECAYPDFKESLEKFIPMDELCHQIWAAIMFCYAISACIKTKYIVGDLFLYFGMLLCFFDCGDRYLWGIFNLTDLDLVFTLPTSLIASSLIYIYVHKTRNLKYQ